LAIRRKLLGNEHLQVAQTLEALARFLQDQGKLTEAEEMFREALAIRRKLFGNAHPDVVRSIQKLATVLQSQGQNEAEKNSYALRLKTIRVQLCLP
jgi:tetratricopeptide (TPR) repeat protein